MGRSNTSAIREALDWIRSNSNVDSDGKVKITVDIPYYASKELLSALTADETDLPERTHRRAVNLAVQRWRKFKKYQNASDSAKAFSEALKIEVRRIEQTTREFEVLVFINLDERDIDKLPFLQILGTKLQVFPWQDLRRLSEAPDWKRLWFQDRNNPIFWEADHEEPIPNFRLYTPIKIDVDTYDVGAAVSFASDRFDVLRAIINISSLLGHFSYFRSRPSHLSLVLPTPIYLVRQNGDVEDIWFTIENYKYKKAKLKERFVQNIGYLMPLFSDEIEEESSYYHLLSILRLYQDALDSSQARPAYLSMWQTIESSVTFPGERVRQVEVISRVASLTKVDPLYRSTLSLLKDIRNSLVHSGEFLDRSDDLFFTLKLIADDCIRRLVILCKDYSSMAELREYFRHISTNSAELRKKSSVISKMLEDRSEN